MTSRANTAVIMLVLIRLQTLDDAILLQGWCNYVAGMVQFGLQGWCNLVAGMMQFRCRDDAILLQGWCDFVAGWFSFMQGWCNFVAGMIQFLCRDDTLSFTGRWNFFAGMMQFHCRDDAVSLQGWCSFIAGMMQYRLHKGLHCTTLLTFYWIGSIKIRKVWTFFTINSRAFCRYSWEVLHACTMYVLMYMVRTFNSHIFIQRV